MLAARELGATGSTPSRRDQAIRGQIDRVTDDMARAGLTLVTGATGFVGSATAPSPLTEAEVDGIINRVHTPQDRPKPKVVFERNEQVRIVDGPFANFNGSVEEIDNDHSRLKVSVTIFGRSTPVELDFASVEKLG